MCKLILHIALLCCCLPGFLAAQNSLREYQQDAADGHPEVKVIRHQQAVAETKTDAVGKLPATEITAGAFVLPVETRVGPQAARFTAMQMFPWFGTDKFARETAALEAKVFQHRLRAKQNEILFRVAKLWYEIYALEQADTVLSHHLQTLDTFEKLVNAKMSSGLDGMASALRIQRKKMEMETEILTISEQLTAKRRQFNLELNRPENSPVPSADTLLPRLLDLDYAALSDSVQMQHPALEAYDAQYAALQSAVAAKRKTGLPMFGFGLSYIAVNRRTDVDMPGNGRDVLLPIVSLKIPLDRKAQRQEEQVIRQTGETVKAEALALENQLRRELAQALADYRSAEAKRQLYLRQVANLEQTQRLLMQAYANSGQDFGDLLMIYDLLRNYDMEYAKALAAQNIAAAKIEMLCNANLEK